MEVRPKKVSVKRLFKPIKGTEAEIRALIEHERNLTHINCDVKVWWKGDRVYKVYCFREQGLEFATLTPVGIDKYNQKKSWKFGYVTPEGDVWFIFNNQVMTEDRDKARAVYQGVKQYVESNNLGTPFAYKVP